MSEEKGRKINYKAVGFKAGLEIHQQLETKHKLFCNCSVAMQEKEPITIIVRKQHPVASELGDIDVAVLHEYLRDRNFEYQVFKNETCLVELDEEPPHELNLEALRIAIEIALLLNCKIPHEIHVMRKTVIDGSNTSGFQRTMVVGLDGYLKYRGERIEIKSINLEEDAAAIVSEENGRVTYRLNRLGIPLVEIATGLITNFTPDEIEDIAYNIGMLCRSTAKVKRGVGTIRQDINVSIRSGGRTEIKGVQELGMLSRVIENEVVRQVSLIEIKNSLRKKGVRKIGSPVDVTNVVKGSESKILRSVIDYGGSVFAILLPKSSGYLNKEIFPGKAFGRELADVALSFGVKVIVHTDEDLSKYQLVEDMKNVRKRLDAKDEDAIILIGEIKTKGKVAEKIWERCKQLLAGLGEETRAAEAEGSTKYTRPLPGAARLYPETDIKPVVVEKEFVEKIRKELPEPWMKKYNRFKNKYRLSDQLARQILRSSYLETFEKIMEMKGIDASIVANTFTNILKDLQKREGVEIERLSERHFVELFAALKKKEIVKEAVPEILKYLSTYPGEVVENAVKELNLVPIEIRELKKVAEEVAVQPGMNYEKAVGIVMSKVRGRIDAQTVMKIVKKVVK